MRKLHGIAVSPGVAIGEAMVMDQEGFRIPRRFVAQDAVEQELVRFNTAVESAAREIRRNRDTVSQELGAEYGAIFEAHLQMLHDPRLRAEIEDLIRQKHFSSEYAVSRSLRRYAKVFQSLESQHLAERANDIFDIEKRLLRHLLGVRREGLTQLTSPVLVLAHNLTPSETASLDRRYVLGFVTEVGGPGSHTAIVAEGMEIPAVVGTGPFLTDVSGGEMVIIDGHKGLVILQPDEDTLEQYRREAKEAEALQVSLQALRDLPAETADGVRVRLLGTIEFPHEVQQCTDRGCDGIGLYRTEFLYLGAQSEPTEEVHYDAYACVVRSMPGKPVVMRTLDLGADKMAHLPNPEDEHNPFLGLRSIRLALRNLPMFRTQLRAILRASVLGDVHVMFPMVSTIRELRQAKMVLADVMEDLEESGIEFRQIPVGMMVEVPSAVMMIDHFVREVDFVSIGTNDLVQYTLAVDRSNKDVAELYNPCDPAVLKLMQMTIQAANRQQIPVYVCGQMTSNPIYTMLLVGMGVRTLSVTPAAIPEIKRLIRAVTIAQCEEVAQRALAMEHARDIKTYLRDRVKHVLPEQVG